MSNIVVGMNESEAAAQALRWAVEQARATRRTVTAILAWGYIDQHHPKGGDRFDPDYTEASAVAAIESYVADALPPSDVGAVRCHVVNNHAVPALMEEAQDADLLVLGSGGRGYTKEFLLGSVTQQCLHHAPCPVAVIHADTALGAPRGRLVVGVDGSPTGRRALDWAVGEAKTRHATIDLVHVWNLPAMATGAYLGMTPDLTFFEDAARALLDQAIASVDPRGLAAPPTPILLSGGAAASILEVARGADMVVVGSRGSGGFAGLLLGSVSHQVAHHATCPVVVVPRAD